MKKYWVTIRATVTKTLTVTAKDEESAVQEAHEMFSVLEDGTDENYEQDTLSVEEIDGNQLELNL